MQTPLSPRQTLACPSHFACKTQSYRRGKDDELAKHAAPPRPHAVPPRPFATQRMLADAPAPPGMKHHQERGLGVVRRRSNSSQVQQCLTIGRQRRENQLRRGKHALACGWTAEPARPLCAQHPKHGAMSSVKPLMPSASS